MIPFLVAACDDASRPAVRPPTVQERAKILRAVADTWEYESAPLPAGEQIDLRRPNLRPRVVRIGVARADPRFSSAVIELRDRSGRRRGPPAVMVFKRIDHDKESEKEFGAWTVEGPTTAIPRACTPATPRGVRTLVCPDPWSVLRYPQPRVHPQTRYAQTISAPDVHTVNWKKITLPGGVCGSSRPIRPRSVTRWEGTAFIHPEAELLWWNPVWVYSWGKPIFGDLDGDGRDEAALSVMCANGGGTAGGQLADRDVIFQARGRLLKVVGITTAQQPLDPRTTHVPLTNVVAIERGKVVVAEVWYGPHDGTCCGSGRARTTWKYADGRLRPLGTKIVRRVWTSPLGIGDLLVNGRSVYGDRVNRIVVTPALRVAFTVDNQSIPEVTKRNVEVTLTISHEGSKIVRTKRIDRIPAWSLQPPRLIFRDVHPPDPGTKATLIVEIDDPGTTPLRYPVIFTRS